MKADNFNFLQTKSIGIRKRILKEIDELKQNYGNLAIISPTYDSIVIITANLNIPGRTFALTIFLDMYPFGKPKFFVPGYIINPSHQRDIQRDITLKVYVSDIFKILQEIDNKNGYYIDDKWEIAREWTKEKVQQINLCYGCRVNVAKHKEIPSGLLFCSETCWKK